MSAETPTCGKMSADHTLKPCALPPRHMQPCEFRPAVRPATPDAEGPSEQEVSAEFKAEMEREGLVFISQSELARLRASDAVLRAAAQAFLDNYLRGVASGDWGNWDPEQEPEVIALRAALAPAASS